MATSSSRKRRNKNPPAENSEQPTTQESKKRPIAASLLAIIGGILIIVSSVYVLSSFHYILNHPANFTNEINATTLAAVHKALPYASELTAVSVICGILIIAFGLSALFISKTLKHSKLMAIAIAIAAFISLPMGGGFIIGLILSVIGAILLFIFKG
jgi:cation transport ATPase